MKTSKKILVAQIGLGLGAIVLYLGGLETTEILTNHFTLTVGYIYGLWHGLSK